MLLNSKTYIENLCAEKKEVVENYQEAVVLRAAATTLSL
jgi:hypothetical protein